MGVYLPTIELQPCHYSILLESDICYTIPFIRLGNSAQLVKIHHTSSKKHLSEGAPTRDTDVVVVEDSSEDDWR